MSFPSSATAAINHLQSSHPYSSFTLTNIISSKGEKLLIIKRRGISVSRGGYKHVFLREEDGCVVGSDQSYGMGAVTVIVKADGTLPLPHESSSASASRARPTLEHSRPGQSDSPSEMASKLYKFAEDAGNEMGIDNKNHVPYLMASTLFALFVIVKVISTFKILILLVPVYFIMKGTLPPVDTFDVKKELKRVLRKEQLPEQHPEKPKGWLNKIVTKAAASVTGELLSSAGYTCRHVTYFDCVTIFEVELTATG
jgi:hypothetical protein